jgi:hypothetical protein
MHLPGTSQDLGSSHALGHFPRCLAEPQPALRSARPLCRQHAWAALCQSAASVGGSLAAASATSHTGAHPSCHRRSAAHRCCMAHRLHGRQCRMPHRRRMAHCPRGCPPGTVCSSCTTLPRCKDSTVLPVPRTSSCAARCRLPLWRAAMHPQRAVAAAHAVHRRCGRAACCPLPQAPPLPLPQPSVVLDARHGPPGQTPGAW